MMETSVEQTLRTLKLSGMAKSWRSIEYRDNEQYMRDLLAVELQERQVNRRNRLVSQAGFRVMKTLDSFIWKPDIELPSSITRAEIEAGSFISKKENLILLGGVGTGKTHLAIAIALSQCHQGRSVRFYTATGLAGLLQEKQERGGFRSFIQALRKIELLVLDEIGFITLQREASELLFQVISECYEQKSLIITSNLEFAQWGSILGDSKLTAALIDRLIHHSHIVVFNGPGHRLEESLKRQRKQ